MTSIIGYGTNTVWSSYDTASYTNYTAAWPATLAALRPVEQLPWMSRPAFARLMLAGIIDSRALEPVLPRLAFVAGRVALVRRSPASAGLLGWIRRGTRRPLRAR